LQKGLNSLTYVGALGFKGNYIKLVWCVTLLLPVAYFLISFFISPVVSFDSGEGFFALRSMLQGGPFNSIVAPDPANIANDSAKFLTWFSPGQYLAPGLFIWLGFNYQTAISLTVLVATILGVFGWFKVAEVFAAPRALTVYFALCLMTFYYVPSYFQIYPGGEILLFAAAPWSLYSLWYGTKASVPVCFGIGVTTAFILFLAKLTGLVVFASTVIAISFVELLEERRVTGAMVALWAAAGTGALCFVVFWHSRGNVPADGSKLAITWAAIWFPVAAASLSGVAGIEALNWFSHTLTSPGPYQLLVKAIAVVLLAAAVATGWILRKQILDYSRRIPFRPLILVAGVAALIMFLVLKYAIHVGIPYHDRQFIRDVMLSVMGCFSLCLASWIWAQLQATKYRTMAVLFLAIICIYTGSMILMFVSGAHIDFEGRHLRYAGTMFFLLFLIALDQQEALRATYIKVLIIGFFGGFGLLSYAFNARELLTQGAYYDPLDFSLTHRMSPGVLEYLHSEQSEHQWRRPVALIPQEAALELPQFRLIGVDSRYWAGEWAQKCRWRGRSEKLFVIMHEQEAPDRSAALLRCFQDYDQSQWSRLQIDGLTIYER
jgi:hypothetical protein